ncbi:ABC transporter ATP-binding protein [Microbacterium sp. USTB-Y]|uniref:ABC transporter ATP-binding protein n=1 Tax=Microbacterium sp. USTB-Y TaxID=2823692 RepID=UPI00203C418F|nr:ABC transporter ATP-binding protein [Microbacterium sp. USTB-Y]
MSSPTAVEHTLTDQNDLLQVTDLRVTFRRGTRDVHAVNGLSYAVDRGKTLAIIGESGSGKSVSSRALMGILPDSATIEGEIRVDGIDLLSLTDSQMRAHRGSTIAMVFQDPLRALNPTMKVGAQVVEAVRAHGGVSRREAKDRALELLRLVRLPEPVQRFHSYPHQLSGGMRQRVAIAVALGGNPRVLVADEATSSLDVTTQAQIMDLLKDLQRELNMALIMISHDLGLAASYADDVIVMYAGRAVERASAVDLFQNVRMPYTKALLEAIPDPRRPPHATFTVAPGQPPDPSQLTSGCAFAPRCARAQPNCAEQAPPFAEDADGHRYACWYPLGYAPELETNNA